MAYKPVLLLTWGYPISQGSQEPRLGLPLLPRFSHSHMEPGSAWAAGHGVTQTGAPNIRATKPWRLPLIFLLLLRSSWTTPLTQQPSWHPMQHPSTQFLTVTLVQASLHDQGLLGTTLPKPWTMKPQEQRLLVTQRQGQAGHHQTWQMCCLAAWPCVPAHTCPGWKIQAALAVCAGI